MSRLVQVCQGAATGLPWAWPMVVSDGELAKDFGPNEPVLVSIQTTKSMVSIDSPTLVAGKLSRTAMSDNPEKLSLSSCLHPSLFHRRLNLAPRPQKH